MTRADYIVVGSGLTGGTIARLLVDHGREVLMLERRAHPGGNVHDFMHPSGIRVHSYGPHYFRCALRETWDFVNRFSKFFEYYAVVRTSVDGQLFNWPLTRSLVDAHGASLRAHARSKPANFEDACLRLFPAEVYERFIKCYTRRQWGIAPDLLDHTLLGRVRINEDHESTLLPGMTYQGLPTLGYARFVANLLAGIPYIGGIDYLECRDEYCARKALIFTGPIDEYFGFDLGRLMYRAQKRRLEFFRAREWHQPCAQVNHPNAEEHQSIRTIEWKHLMPAPQRAQVSGTVITDEYPFTPENPNDYEYPVPVRSNRHLYARYHRRAMKVPRLIVCGRLGECRYLDMNHAIENATAIAHRLLRSPRRRCMALQPELHCER